MDEANVVVRRDGDQQGSGLRRTRRALLAGLAGGAGALIANAIGRVSPTRASAGSPLILGTDNYAGSAPTRLHATSSGGAFWMTQNGSGSGVRGESYNGTGGVFTTAHKDRYGLLVEQNATSAGNGAGIRVVGGKVHGLVATTDGLTEYAVFATNSGTSGGGVVNGTAGGAIYGRMNDGNAIRGESQSGTGLVGVASSGTGVYGASDTGGGVFGYSGSSIGVAGSSEGAAGVSGTSSSSHGLYGRSQTGYGLYATTESADGVAGYFDGGVTVTGTLLTGSFSVASFTAGSLAADTVTAGSSSATGAVVRGLTDGAALDDLHPSGTEDPGAGEFAGTNGVIGAATGSGYGVLALAPSGTGVRAKSVFGTAVEATSASGTALSGVSSGGYGIYGSSTGSLAGYFDGPVRSASADAATPGLHAASSAVDGIALVAENTSGGSGDQAGSGILALTGGATASDLSGTELPDAAGEFAGPVGVIGVTNITDGTPAYGVVGISTAYVGVHGFSTSHIGVFGLSVSGIGLYGSSDTGDAGSFDGSVALTKHLHLQSTLSDPTAPASDAARLFARTNGSGKVELCVRFPGGAIQVLATEP